MRFMAMVKSTPDMEAGEMPSEDLLRQMGEFNEEMVNAGVMVAGEGLLASSEGARVEFGGEQPTVKDGPFAETKELIAGFWIMECDSLEDAVAWIKRTPNPEGVHSEIEIRRVAQAEDFGEEFTPELREQEDRLREQAEENAK